MDNLAYDYDYYHDNFNRDELLDGKLFIMSPTPFKNHNIAAGNVSYLFRRFLWGKQCVILADPFDVVLSDKDRVRPDVMVVCDRTKIKDYEVEGAPDLVVEVSSPSTVKNDFGYKMNLYARAGVREYWIINVREKTVQVYLPFDGRFELSDAFAVYPEQELARMTEEERANVKTEFSPFIFPDMKITLDEVFDGMLE